LERTGSSDGDGGDTTDQPDTEPLQTPGGGAFPPPQPEHG
jgi:hypothetical protein